MRLWKFGKTSCVSKKLVIRAFYFQTSLTHDLISKKSKTDNFVLPSIWLNMKMTFKIICLTVPYQVIAKNIHSKSFGVQQKLSAECIIYHNRIHVSEWEWNWPCYIAWVQPGLCQIYLHVLGTIVFILIWSRWYDTCT
jgi:hypothetical protein